MRLLVSPPRRDLSAPKMRSCCPVRNDTRPSKLVHTCNRYWGKPKADTVALPLCKEKGFRPTSVLIIVLGPYLIGTDSDKRKESAESAGFAYILTLQRKHTCLYVSRATMKPYSIRQSSTLTHLPVAGSKARDVKKESAGALPRKRSLEGVDRLLRGACPFHRRQDARKVPWHGRYCPERDRQAIPNRKQH